MAQRRSFSCPICIERLRLVRVGGRRAHQCASGDGLFLDATDLAAFFSAQSVKLVWKRSRRGKSAAKFCPRCTRTMTRFDFEGTELDICKRCGGLWFDKGELRKVVVGQARRTGAPKAARR